MSKEIKSNINMYYESFIDDLAECAKTWLNDNKDYDVDEVQAVSYAIDNNWIYHVDHAYVLAYAYLEGYAVWGGDVDWVHIGEMVWQDTYNELKNKLEEK